MFENFGWWISRWLPVPDGFEMGYGIQTILWEVKSALAKFRRAEKHSRCMGILPAAKARSWTSACLSIFGVAAKRPYNLCMSSAQKRPLLRGEQTLLMSLDLLLQPPLWGQQNYWVFFRCNQPWEITRFCNSCYKDNSLHRLNFKFMTTFLTIT